MHTTQRESLEINEDALVAAATAAENQMAERTAWNWLFEIFSFSYTIYVMAQ